MKAFVLVCPLLLVYFTNPLAIAQSKSSQYHVSSDMKGVPHVEPYIWVDEQNEKNIIIVCNVLLENGAECHGFSSLNGGRTWKRYKFKDTWLDPWITSLNNKVYFSAIKKSKSFNPIIVYHTADGGITWNKFWEANIPISPQNKFIQKLGSLDRPSITIDSFGQMKILASQGYRSIHNQIVLSPVIYNLNTNTGSSSDPIRLIQNNLMSNVSNIIQTGNQVGFAYVEFGINIQERTERLHTNRLWWVGIKNNIVSTPHLITEISATKTLPLSIYNKRNQRIYITYSDKRNDSSGIYLQSSNDSGATWSKREIVIEDNQTIFVNPVIAANVDGTIGVAWYDNEKLDSENCWNVKFSFSKNESKAFSKPIKLSSEAFCTMRDGKAINGSRRWKFGGDYFGLATSKLGIFHVTWCDTSMGVYQLFYTTMDINSL